MDELRIHCEVVGSEVLVCLGGVLDARTCPTMQDGLELARTMSRGRRVVIDLGDVEVLSVAAQACLAAAIEADRRAGHAMVLRGLPSGIGAMLATRSTARPRRDAAYVRGLACA